MTRRIAALRPSWASDLTTKSSQGDDELGAAQASAHQALREGLLRSHSTCCARGTFGYFALALLEVGGVEPEIGPVADQRAVQEGVHAVVDVLAEFRFRLTRWLYVLCWTGDDRPGLLFDRATTWLLAHKVLLQHVTTATAINFDRIAAWFGGRRIAPTRTSRFAALAT